MKNIFLTGDIKVGKSTILNNFLLSYKGIIGGFKTEPYFLEDSQKTFVLKSLNQLRRPKANQYICKPSASTGRLIPITQTFDDFGVEILNDCLEEKPNIIIMDELGIFESAALKFQENIYKCLASQIPVIGVIKNKESKFLNDLRSRTDLLIISITLENREIQKAKFFQYATKLLFK